MTPPKTAARALQDADIALASALRSLVAMPGGPPGVIAVVQRGGQVRTHTAGYGEIATKRPPRARVVAGASPAGSGVFPKSRLRLYSSSGIAAKSARVRGRLSGALQGSPLAAPAGERGPLSSLQGALLRCGAAQALRHALPGTSGSPMP